MTARELVAAWRAGAAKASAEAAERRHAAAEAAWSEIDHELQQRIRFLTANPVTAFVGGDVPVQLKRGEQALLVLDGAALVEPKRQPGHYAGGYTGFSVRVTRNLRWHAGGSRGRYRPGPDVPTPVDTGVATITNQRVVFQGAKKTREWAFSKLIGYQHQTDAPWTAIQVSNRQSTSGILYTTASGPEFHFRLAAAVAMFNGRASNLVEALEQERREHLAARPAPPPAAKPVALPATRSAALVTRAGALPRKAKVGAVIAGVVLVAAIAGGANDHKSTDVRLTASAADASAMTSTTTSTSAPTTMPSTTTTLPPTTTTITVPPTTTAPPTTASPPTTAAPVAVVAAPASGACHPSYANACVPVARDVDCSGGGGNGPAYVDGPVRVVGPDVYDLDRDGDGWGCES